MQGNPMKKSIVMFSLIMVALPAALVAQQAEYKAGELLVKFDPAFDVQQVLSETTFTDLNMNIIRHFPHLGVWHVTFETPAITDQVVLAREVIAGSIPVWRLGSVAVRCDNQEVYITDPDYNLQWHLTYTGQATG